MPKRHFVLEGDCISSIAYRYGFAPETLWNYPDNRELKTQRKDNLNVLNPNDVVAIPDRVVKEVSAATDQRHVFKRVGIPVKVHLRLLDENNQPRAGLAYRLDTGTRLYRGTTDGHGEIRHSIIPNTASVTLLLPEGEQYIFRLGYIDPVTERSGVCKRLQNLNLLGAADVELEYRRGLRLFREKYCGVVITAHSRSYTSEPDLTSAEQAVLVEVHGS